MPRPFLPFTPLGVICSAFSFLLSQASFAEDLTGRDWEDAACRIFGVADISEFPEETFQHLEDLHEHPLSLNLSSRERLRATGLFTSYQLESLVDYRARFKNVLSVMELSAVDGFTLSIAGDMAFFLSFDSYESASDSQARVRASAGGGFKATVDEGGQGQYMAKAGVDWKGLSAAIATRSSWSRPLGAPSIPAGYISYTGRRWLTEVVAGYYNARFGQGLALWSGSFFSSVATPASLMRKASSIVPYGSYSSQYAMLGVAARMDFSRISLSPFVDFSNDQNLGFGANLAWNHRHGEIGFTSSLRIPYPDSETGAVLSSDICGSCSVDFQHTFGGTVAFGELAFVKSDAGALERNILKHFAFLAGTRFPAGPLDCALRISADKSELGCVGAVSYVSPSRVHFLDLSLSAVRLLKYAAIRYRVLSSYSCKSLEHMIFTSRVDLQCRTGYFKFDIRQDVKWEKGVLSAGGRLDFAYCKALSFLAYAECGCSTEGKFSQQSFLQFGLFKVDNWDDRIYVYQRDVPSSFNVPAMYGRGLWLSLYSKVKVASWGKLYVRCSYTAYPWARPTDTRRRSSFAAKLEFVVDI